MPCNLTKQLIASQHPQCLHNTIIDISFWATAARTNLSIWSARVIIKLLWTIQWLPFQRQRLPMLQSMMSSLYLRVWPTSTISTLRQSQRRASWHQLVAWVWPCSGKATMLRQRHRVLCHQEWINIPVITRSKKDYLKLHLKPPRNTSNPVWSSKSAVNQAFKAQLSKWGRIRTCR